MRVPEKRGVRVRVHRLSEGEKNYLTSITDTSKLTRALQRHIHAPHKIHVHHKMHGLRWPGHDMSGTVATKEE